MENQALDIVAHTDVATPAIDLADFDRLEKMAESFSISSEYLKFERPGDSQRVFWVGWTTFQSKQKDESTGLQKVIPAGVFMWRESPTSGPKRVIHGGSNLVRQLENIGYSGQPLPLKITLMGKKKANTGNSFDEFEVVVLNGGTRTNAPNSTTDTNEQQAPQTPKAALLPVTAANRSLVSDLQDDITEGYFDGEPGVERLKGAMVVVTEQLAARKIDKEFVKAKAPKQTAWSIFRTAVSIMARYDQDAPVAA